MSRAESGISDLFEAADVQGFLHAVDLATGAELGVGSGDPVVLASVFKIPVLVELFRMADAGCSTRASR